MRHSHYCKSKKWRQSTKTFVSLNELNNDEIQIHKTLTTTNKKAIKQAKLKELDQWTKEVYDEVNDIGQLCKFLRWVLKEEIIINGQKAAKTH